MMTEEQKQALIHELESRRAIMRIDSDKLWEYDWFADEAYRIALAALTQPASPAFKLPDDWVAVPREATREMIESGWTYHLITKDPSAKGIWACMIAAAPTVPHTAPIEPICATGGAEWVSIEDELPRDGSWCIAIEEGNFAGDVVYWENGAWKSEFGRDEYTHWMYHPAAAED